MFGRVHQNAASEVKSAIYDCLVIIFNHLVLHDRAIGAVSQTPFHIQGGPPYSLIKFLTNNIVTKNPTKPQVYRYTTL